MRILLFLFAIILPPMTSAEPLPDCDPTKGFNCPRATQGTTPGYGAQQPSLPYLPRAPRRIPLSSLIRKLEVAGFDPILEIEREDNGWEVEAEYKGQAVEFRLDPWTGRVLEHSFEDESDGSAKE